jgi:hypothetical protein
MATGFEGLEGSMKRESGGYLLFSLTALVLLSGIAHAQNPVTTAKNPLRNAYFGDLHLHTMLSFDAFTIGTRTTPDDAYRYAKGEPIDYLGSKIQRKIPLDFLGVTDHAEYMGVIRMLADPNSPLSKSSWATGITSTDPQTRSKTFLELAKTISGSKPIPEFVDERVLRSNWQIIIDAAERAYQPGKFTTFIAYEWTSFPDNQNLHRNVIFRSSKVPPQPFSVFDSQKPEDLWTYLETARKDGIEALAIPHNANVSNGLMYGLVDSDNQPIDRAYVERRMTNEPVNEIVQIKGQSETHPGLSANDELANFELYEHLLATDRLGKIEGSYARNAFRRGLEIEEKVGANPYKFGVIGSTDSHAGASVTEEINFPGAHGALDATPQARLRPEPTAAGEPAGKFSTGGLAGVWAEENTREAIFDALTRKEVFATSGTRIKVRLFGGWNYMKTLNKDKTWIKKAYAGGVPMGGDLPVKPENAKAPKFLLWALKDPESAPLQRLQIIKGWTENGTSQEQIFDVACSDKLTPDPRTHRCPDNGATVNLNDCSITKNKGTAELSTVWTDPTFNAGQRAFYYARVIENPVCRWSTWDALRNKLDLPKHVPATIQERAWSSPIWYTPTRTQ